MVGVKVLRRFVFFFVILCVLGGGVFLYAHHNWNPLPSGATIDRIVVQKSAHKLSVYSDGQLLKSYAVALGDNPVGPKRQEGDLKTPEGIYSIDSRNPQSLFHLALHVSYPSAEDTARAAAEGVPAGFDIMIHGLPNGRRWIGAFHRWHDWTAGCIAVTDEQIEEIYRITANGTTVEILP